MSVIAAALKHMLASGMPHDAIVQAVAEMELNLASAEQNALAKRRASDRERQAKHRAGNVMSRDKRDKRDIPSPQDKAPPDPPKTQPLTPCESEREKARARVRATWPDDYEAKAWAEYGQPREKKVSIQALRDLRNSGRVTWDDFLGGVHRQADNVEPQFRPSLQRFIRRERWSDEYLGQGATGPPFEARPMQRSLKLVNGNHAHAQALKPSVTDVLCARIAARDSG